MIGDTSTTGGNQRWTNAEIYDAIDWAIAEMYLEWRDVAAGPFLANITMTYTVDSESVILPAAIRFNSLYRVEDYTDTTNPIYIDYIDPIDVDRFADRYGWTLLGNNIALRPKPTTEVTLRIHYLTYFIPVSTGGDPTNDQHALPPDYEELIALGAAIRLQENDSEVPPSRIARFERLWELFVRTCDRIKGPEYVRATRHAY